MQPLFKVHDEWATIRTIVEEKASIARYGDGEFNLAKGRNAKAQIGDPTIAQRLREILKSNSDCLVGIPNMYNGIQAGNPKAQNFWETMASRRHYDELLSPNKQYYSSFISRPDNAAAINTHEYFDYCQKIWDKRKVVLVCGEGVPFCKNDDYLGNAETLASVRGPAVNAWSEYSTILKRCMAFSTDYLFLLRLGPTATVLAYDLCRLGYQAVDLGHFGRFYERLLRDNPTLEDYDNSITAKGHPHAS